MLWWCCAAPRAEPPEARSERDNLFSKPREESEAAPLAAEQAADDAESTTAAMSTEDAIRGPKKPALRFEQHEALVELRSLAQPEPFGQVWTVHEELGRGAFAIVRRATRNGLVRRGSFRAKHDGACSAAVKCFGPSSTLGAGASAELSPSLAADLALEVSILRSLTCPEHGDERCDAVVHMLGFYVSEDGARGELSCQLVMDLVGGGELFDRLLLRSHYTEANARALFARVLDAMRFCHENLIVHRDLKPENLLLKSRDDDEDVAVGDFGGAARLARPGALIEDSVVGTPGFMAPEMIKGEPHGEPVDLWACGCILFILLVGEAPFTGNGSKTRRAKYAFAPALKWASISDDAKDLVTKLLVAEPAKRLTARAALRHPWFLLNADHSLLARNLDHTIEGFKKFNAKKKFKSTVDAIIHINRLSSSLSQSRKASNAENAAEVPQPSDVPHGPDCNSPECVADRALRRKSSLETADSQDADAAGGASRANAREELALSAVDVRV